MKKFLIVVSGTTNGRVWAKAVPEDSGVGTMVSLRTLADPKKFSPEVKGGTLVSGVLETIPAHADRKGTPDPKTGAIRQYGESHALYIA